MFHLKNDGLRHNNLLKSCYLHTFPTKLLLGVTPPSEGWDPERQIILDFSEINYESRF